jgi:cytochrome d ubiquinol oxidase subunit II
LIFPLLAIAGLVYAWMMARARKELNAFLGSSAYLTGMLSSAAFGLFPFILPSCLDRSGSLTISNAASPGYGLQVALIWWIPGMALAVLYAAYVYRRFAGKVLPLVDSQ